MGWKFKVGILVWSIMVFGVSFLVGRHHGADELKTEVLNKQLGFYEFNSKTGKIELHIKTNPEIVK